MTLWRIKQGGTYRWVVIDGHGLDDLPRNIREAHNLELAEKQLEPVEVRCTPSSPDTSETS